MYNAANLAKIAEQGPPAGEKRYGLQKD